MLTLQRTSSFLPAAFLFLVALTFAMGAKEIAASHAPAPVAGGKARPTLYALLQVVRRPGVSTSEAYHREAAVFKKSKFPIVYPVLEDPRVRRLKLIKEQAKPHVWLMDHLRIDFFDDTGVFKLSLDGGTLEEQAIILNAILQVSSRVQEKRQKAVADTIETLKKTLASDKAGIAQMEKLLTDGTVDRLPPQINRAQYIQDHIDSIESHK